MIAKKRPRGRRLRLRTVASRAALSARSTAAKVTHRVVGRLLSLSTAAAGFAGKAATVPVRVLATGTVYLHAPPILASLKASALRYIISPIAGNSKSAYTTLSTVHLNALAAVANKTGAVTISSLSVDHASVGEQIWIYGSGFGASQGTSKVYFGTTEAASYLDWGTSAIRVVVPSMSAGTQYVTVVVGAVTSNQAYFYIPSSVLLSSLSADHASIGAQITITGSGFGASRGTSTVTFGEPQVSTPSASGDVKWAPVTKEAASYVSWSNTQITVTVPSMSPGAAGYPGTYHRVRVYVGGTESNAADFYIDPRVVNPSSMSDVGWSAANNFITNSVTRTAKSSYADVPLGQAGGVQGYDYVAPTNAWWGIMVQGENILFMNSTFECNCNEIPGSYAGIVTLYKESAGRTNWANVTFLNCRFKQNWGAGTQPHDGYEGNNGLKVSGYADVTVSDSYFERFSRMSYEEVQGDGGTRAKFYNCTFDPCGNQAISFNGNETGMFALFDSCTIYGWGNHATFYPSGAAAWESNAGRYIHIKDCTFWAGEAIVFNINGLAADPTRPCHVFIEGCDVLYDTAHRTYMSRSRSHYYGCAPVYWGNHTNYMRWKDCNFMTGDTTWYLSGMAETGWSQFVTGGDNRSHRFENCTIHGYINWNNSGLVLPQTAVGYIETRDGGGTIDPSNDLSGLTVTN